MDSHNLITTIIIAALCPALSTSAGADPAATVQYLSSEPATLLDLGLHRLEMIMDQFAKHPEMQMRLATGVETPIVTTSYYAEKPRILIQAHYYFSKPSGLSGDALKPYLEEKIKLMKLRLGIDPSEGAPLAATSLLLPAFSHQDGKGNIKTGEAVNSALKEIAWDLDEMVVLSARVGTKAACTSSLRSTQTRCKNGRDH